MHLFELVLILLACVMASAILDQIVSHMGLPLLQIGVGVVMAFLIPGLSQIEVDAELFMALFITPLLFMEAKETDRSMLWKNKASVLSMAITLVIAAALSYYITKVFSLLFGLKPFKNRDKSKSSEAEK